jgi:hypothetical protein
LLDLLRINIVRHPDRDRDMKQHGIFLTVLMRSSV